MESLSIPVPLKKSYSLKYERSTGCNKVKYFSFTKRRMRLWGKRVESTFCHFYILQHWKYDKGSCFQGLVDANYKLEKDTDFCKIKKPLILERQGKSQHTYINCGGFFCVCVCL